jgi:hypothetical protein
VVSARTPSSASTRTPSLVRVGMISSRNSPRACAAAARSWERAAKASWSARETPYLAATFSDVVPIGTRQSRARGHSPTASKSTTGVASVMLLKLMLSTPAPMPASITPALMAP